jgi:Tfp pilus assembly protein PilV
MQASTPVGEALFAWLLLLGLSGLAARTYNDEFSAKRQQALKSLTEELAAQIRESIAASK